MRGAEKIDYRFLVFLIGAVVVASGVKINKLHVPEVIRHGDAVVLDCDFTLEDAEQDLVVKWFFNKNNRTLIYQWIPASRSHPQVLGVLKDRLNVHHAAVPSVDANVVHRALHILDPGPDLSGDYTCSVSTMQSEDIRTKSMLVFVPEKSLLIRRVNAEGGLQRVRCIAEGVFPHPKLSLLSTERDSLLVDITSRQRGHLYDVSATTAPIELLTPEEFSCELSIPQANYSVKRETVIYPGNRASIANGGFRLVSAILPVLLIRRIVS